MDMPFNSGTIKGFFGRSDDSADSKIYRLGLIWARSNKLDANETEVKFAETSDMVDSADFATLQKNQTAGTKNLEDKLSATQKVSFLLARSRCIILIFSRPLTTAVTGLPSLRRFGKVHQRWRRNAGLSLQGREAGGPARTLLLVALSTSRVVTRQHPSCSTV